MDTKNVDNVILEWAFKVSESYQKKVRDANIRYTGNLEDTVYFGVKTQNIIREVFLELAEEWKYVEYGRKPGKFPNIGAMIEYVRNKPITPKPFTLPNGKTKIPTENQLAFLIGRKIQEEGVAPKNLLSETLDEMKEELITGLRESYAESIKNEVMNELKK